ncbi:sigma factor-like helix-turn-helix DNA-binding protein [Paenibacillus sp. LHD-38]|uniref:sigma factor-like helix-turn-helix DNA-binding protein n=1 Tax=Paenibacillus sp. LHD-38 TaxID=3072143 RepID=UPI00280C8966|nr:sigma factor-like helix-turn-helix DNA-binding protein [Paenibacillus sp. LHD-38]MDQ8738594.1 sigma factor-like helix-turn-helix DNA-binding protein [Paenibacillus sp. LHD-38]
MMSILNRMPDKYREALELSELQGMSQKQLSEHLNIFYSGELVKEMLTSCCSIEADHYGNIVEYCVIHDEPKPRRSPINIQYAN